MSVVNSTPDPLPSPWALITGGKLGMTFCTPPCPQGSLDDASERPLCKRWKVEETHHVSPAVSAAVCRCEVHTGFQASSCNSASSARQAAELNGIQVTLKYLAVKISLKLVAGFPNLDCLSLCIQRLRMLLIPSVKSLPLEISRMVSVFLTNPQLFKG